LISLTQMLGGSAGDKELVALLGLPDNDAGTQAALGLISHGPRAVPFAIDALHNSPSGPARHGAAMVLTMVCAGYNPSIEAFVMQAQATHRQEGDHRSANLVALEPLIFALQHDSYAPTREIAAQGLGYLGSQHAAGPLAAALKDPDALVRRRAASALITVPASTVVPQLSAAATQDEAPQVRRFAVEALGWVGGAAVVPALKTATKDTDASVRRYAAIQLGRIADPSSLMALTGMLGRHADPDADVRWAAVQALGKLHDKGAERVLVQALSDPSPQVSNSAERALQRLGIATQEKAGFES
jgi:hypothetical protein